MKTRSKLLIVVAMVILILSCILVACGDNQNNLPNFSEFLELRFNEQTQSYSIVNCAKDATDFELPSEYNGFPVTSIDGRAFSGCVNLTSITIPASVTRIGYQAFEGCSGLTRVVIPEGVSSIEPWLFNGCVNLVSVNIPNSVMDIYDEAFRGCKSLTSITIPDGVTNIAYATFAGCESLTSIVIPNGVTRIGSSAFAGCTNLADITIPDSVTALGNSPFEGTAWYNNQPDGIVYVGKIAYRYKGSMPTNTALSLKDGTTSVADGVFNGCTGLISITIPASVTYIYQGAFSNCSDLKTVIVADGNSTYHSDGNCLIETASKTLMWGCETSVIPQGGSVDHIGNSAFFNCYGLIEIEIPESVTSIGDLAFSGCTNLTSITIPSGITSISDMAFGGCTGLTAVHITDITAWCGISYNYSMANPLYYAKNLYLNNELVTDIIIPDGITSISPYVFYNCTSLTSITLPDSLTSIGDEAFKGCTGLTNIVVPDGITSIGDEAFVDTAWYDNQPDGVLYVGKVAYRYKGVMPNNTTIVIKDGTTSISEDAFLGHEGLIGITIPNSVTNIGHSAFFGCSNLISATVPAYAIRHFTPTADLQTLVITSGSLDNNTLFGSDDLTSITISKYVVEIDPLAFMDCTNLTSIAVEDGNPVYHSAGNCLIETESGMLFYGCKTSVIPQDGSVKSLCGAFFRCPGLTDIVIPNGVTTIIMSFTECPDLTAVTIPNSVTNIEFSTFYGCSSLVSIIFDGTKAQWLAIYRDNGSIDNVGDFVVHCTDGDLDKNGNEI